MVFKNSLSCPPPFHQTVVKRPLADGSIYSYPECEAQITELIQSKPERIRNWSHVYQGEDNFSVIHLYPIFQNIFPNEIKSRQHEYLLKFWGKDRYQSINPLSEFLDRTKGAEASILALSLLALDGKGEWQSIPWRDARYEDTDLTINPGPCFIGLDQNKMDPERFEKLKLSAKHWPNQVLTVSFAPYEYEFGDTDPTLIPNRLIPSEEIKEGFRIVRDHCFSCHPLFGKDKTRMVMGLFNFFKPYLDRPTQNEIAKGKEELNENIFEKDPHRKNQRPNLRGVLKKIEMMKGINYVEWIGFPERFEKELSKDTDSFFVWKILLDTFKQKIISIKETLENFILSRISSFFSFFK